MQQALAPSNLRWSHATNTLALIDSALAGDVVHFIEADVCYDDDVGPYMAHAATDITTLRERQHNSFRNWLDYLTERRTSLLNPGLKLDFKMTEAVRPSIDRLLHVQYPVWLNADILKGPRGFDPVFNAAEFIQTSLRVPSATLSLGWTTGAVKRSADPVGYSKEMIDEMLQLCRDSLFDKPVTFPVRAIDALNSQQELHRLLSHGNQWTLTIWNGSEGLSDDEEQLLRKVFDSNRTYIDIVKTFH